MTRTIRIALFLCGTPVKQVQDAFNAPTYTPAYISFLEDTLNSYPDRDQGGDVELVVDSFDVVENQEYPDDEKLRNGYYTAVMMTGSGKLMPTSCRFLYDYLY